MREKLNQNPLVQAVVFGVLALVVVFLFVSRMGGGGGGEGAPPAETVATAPTDTAAGAAGTAASATAPATEPTTPAPADAAGVAGDTDPVAPGSTAAFVAGPGLPVPVVKAYADGEVVVLLVTRQHGIDDRRLKAQVERLRADPDVALFETNAKGIARYSRITNGVDVNRTPAMVVMKPRQSTKGAPVASVYYGFRGPGSIGQAVADARYKGKDNLPYYPK